MVLGPLWWSIPNMALTWPNFVSISINWIVFDFVSLSLSILLTGLMNSMGYIDGFLAKLHEPKFSWFCGLNFVSIMAKIMDFGLRLFFKISMIKTQRCAKNVLPIKYEVLRNFKFYLVNNLGLNDNWNLKLLIPALLDNSTWRLN